MKVNIQDQTKNPFLNRVRVDGVINHSKEATPSEEEVKGFLSKSLKEDEEKIEIDYIYTRKGRNISDFSALINDVESVDVEEVSEKTEKSEEKDEEQVGGESEAEEEEDYDDILSGTIGEGKEKINDLDSPDYEKLLQMEKDGKDRKGMKGFLEGNLED